MSGRTSRRRAATAADAASSAGALAAEDLSSLLQALYGGAMESPPWTTALERLREAFGAAQATLLLRPPKPGSAGALVASGTNVSPEGTASYRTHFFALDPFVGLPRDEVVTVHEWVGEEKWLKSAIYRDFMRPIGMLHVMGADLVSEGFECHLRLCRSQEQPAFGETDKARCRMLLAHLKLAIALHARLDSLACERQVFAGALDRMLFGTISFDAAGAVLEVNEQAKAILSQKDGIRLSGNGLRADNAQENEELQRLIGRALAGAASATDAAGWTEALSLSRASGRAKLGVLVRMVPLGEWSEGGQRPASIVFLRDPEHKAAASRDVVRRLFHLTRSEATLSLLLADGLSLEDAAKAMGNTHNTARSHLRSIYAKTGATRQSDLVRIILNSVASLSRP